MWFNHRVAIAAFLLLSACDLPIAQDVSVRQIGSNVAYPGGGVETLFVFNPVQDRPLRTRIALAKKHIAQTPNCRIISTDPELLATLTRKQGKRYTDSLLVAPVACT